MSSYCLSPGTQRPCVFLCDPLHTVIKQTQLFSTLIPQLPKTHYANLVSDVRERRKSSPAAGMKLTPAGQQWRKPCLSSVIMDNVFQPPCDRASVTPSASSRCLTLLGRSTSGVHPGRLHLQPHKLPAFTFLYLLRCTPIYVPRGAVSSFNLCTQTHLHKAHLLDFLKLLQSHLWIYNSPCRIPPSAFSPLH